MSAAGQVKEGHTPIRGGGLCPGSSCWCKPWLGRYLGAKGLSEGPAGEIAGPSSHADPKSSPRPELNGTSQSSQTLSSRNNIDFFSGAFPTSFHSEEAVSPQEKTPDQLGKGAAN